MKDLDEDELAECTDPGDGSCEHLITARMAAEIRRRRDAFTPDAVIAVIDYVLDESGLGPKSRASVRAFALQMLARSTPWPT